ncbi:hypothetical protein MTR67_052336 [Solanum verrucosum]|uniref:Tf2-1-like SH3-like domain-containing protein n=1 Tax=Solanum verrucosum TaxID=315347 RepID=A0AAF1A0Y5_SOLVR|nr:hypothetical protein MTR67_052336 [Solanum verrucosum]
MQIISFLGHILSDANIVVDTQKIEGVKSWPKPMTPTELTQKAAKFQWTEACEHSFLELKDRLTSTPVLALPESSEGYTVYCDASDVMLGCVLMQHGKVFLKVSPMKAVIQFGKKGKLSPRFIGSYRILRRVGQVAYELELPLGLESIDPVFHVSVLQKCVGDPSRVVLVEDVQIKEKLSYEETLVAILDRQGDGISVYISAVRVKVLSYLCQPVRRLG